MPEICRSFVTSRTFGTARTIFSASTRDLSSGTQPVRGAHLDRFVVDLGAGRAAVLERAVGGRAARADHHRHAALQRECCCNQQGYDGAAHFFAPTSWKSIASHRQCSTRRCTSWMRAVLLCGTQIWTSLPFSIPAILPPLLPVSAMTCTPSSCATWIASITLAELPLVEMASSAPARATGSPSVSAACAFSLALSAKCAATRPRSVASTVAIARRFYTVT